MKEHEKLEMQIDNALVQNQKYIPGAAAIKVIIWTLIDLQKQHPELPVNPLLENYTKFLFDEQSYFFDEAERLYSLSLLRNIRDLVRDFSK